MSSAPISSMTPHMPNFCESARIHDALSARLWKLYARLQTLPFCERVVVVEEAAQEFHSLMKRGGVHLLSEKEVAGTWSCIFSQRALQEFRRLRKPPSYLVFGRRIVYQRSVIESYLASFFPTAVDGVPHLRIITTLWKLYVEMEKAGPEQRSQWVSTTADDLLRQGINEYVSEAEVATLWPAFFTLRSLQKLRKHGEGPLFAVIHRKIIYRRGDVVAYLQERVKPSVPGRG